jgi:hypothetical protein
MIFRIVANTIKHPLYSTRIQPVEWEMSASTPPIDGKMLAVMGVRTTSGKIDLWYVLQQVDAKPLTMLLAQFSTTVRLPLTSCFNCRSERWPSELLGRIWRPEKRSSRYRIMGRRLCPCLFKQVRYVHTPLWVIRKLKICSP